MNQQTLQKIYKAHQPHEYYSRYFKELNLREDSRLFTQNRDIKITVRQNTVAVSKGQTIVIAQIQTQVQRLIYSSIEKSYGNPLVNLNVKFPTFKGSMRENRFSASIEQFVNSKIQWRLIEDQLVVKQTGNRYFAHTGDIEIRVVSNDGCLNEVCLLAVQLILWCSKFNKIEPQTGSLKSDQFILELPNFYFPSKYCEIMGQILSDPTLSEQDSSSYMICLIGDLLSENIADSAILIQKIKKNCQKIENNKIESVVSMWKVDIASLGFDIKDLRRRVNESEYTEQPIDLLICQ